MWNLLQALAFQLYLSLHYSLYKNNADCCQLGVEGRFGIPITRSFSGMEGSYQSARVRITFPRPRRCPVFCENYQHSAKQTRHVCAESEWDTNLQILSVRKSRFRKKCWLLSEALQPVMTLVLCDRNRIHSDEYSALVSSECVHFRFFSLCNLSCRYSLLWIMYI